MQTILEGGPTQLMELIKTGFPQTTPAEQGIAYKELLAMFKSVTAPRFAREAARIAKDRVKKGGFERSVPNIFKRLPAPAGHPDFVRPPPSVQVALDNAAGQDDALPAFGGKMEGYSFRNGIHGVGYYRD